MYVLVTGYMIRTGVWIVKGNLEGRTSDWGVWFQAAGSGVNLGVPIGQWWTALLPWGDLALITFMLVKMVLRLVRS